jgi:hypothetical protein
VNGKIETMYQMAQAAEMEAEELWEAGEAMRAAERRIAAQTWTRAAKILEGQL